LTTGSFGTTPLTEREIKRWEKERRVERFFIKEKSLG
jgi:hypothetical protein